MIQPSLINKGKKLFLAGQMWKILSKQDGPILPARAAKGSQMLQQKSEYRSNNP